MRSPSCMEFIQIDITNACNMRCSNCTRFCGNHKKPFFMNFETFKRAVDSMEGFDGVVGLIGGEPTLHPEFERFALYMQEKFGKQMETAIPYPQKDFIHEIHRREFGAEKLRTKPDGSYFMKKYGAGLWSNMSGTYRKHYELIQDTFAVQYLNDHINPSYHQPGLFSRKDLGISDEAWIPMRDKCWIQNTWSATITPKGAFFCEVAGALDMLFNGPGGWKIEPGWWKRTPEEFGDQLHWCEICGFALEGTFTRDSQEEMDDVSPTLYQMLRQLESPKLKAGKINPVRISNGVIDPASKAEDRRFVIGDRYIAKYEDRFHEKNSVLFEMNCKETVIQDGEHFGRTVNQMLYEEGVEWLLLKESDSISAEELKQLLGRRVFNPGSLHVGEGYVFFSKNAYSLRTIGFDRIARMTTAAQLQAVWDPEKVVRIDETDKMTDLHRKSLSVGKRYVIWGTGMLGEFFAESVTLSGGHLVFAVDKAVDRQGKTFSGVRIHAPQELRDKAEEYDVLLVAHHLCFEDIEREALKMGIPKEKIMLPYEV